ncbi:hypothetical protein RSK20926_20057 [Roseobacter sp. SK209-2-6]|nr:hypothetical protein RSK20926_20057 [Roseobacter sp. SK209-2-6]
MVIFQQPGDLTIMIGLDSGFLRIEIVLMDPAVQCREANAEICGHL